jgi:hypothetical protein
MLRSSAICLVLVLSCVAPASTQTLSIGEQPFSTFLSHLPNVEQESILKGVQPGIARRAKQFDLDESELVAVKKNLRIGKIVTRTGTLTLVQSYGMELCGAVGNCAVWALGKNDRLILETGGNGIQILKTFGHGYPSILMFDHMSAFQTGMTWYSFDGNQYVRVKCAVQTYSDGSQKYSPPKIEYGPCEK